MLVEPASNEIRCLVKDFGKETDAGRTSIQRGKIWLIRIQEHNLIP